MAIDWDNRRYFIVDLVNDIKNAVGNGVSAVGDTVGNIFNGVKESVDSVLHPIDTLLGSWGSDMLEGAMKIANKTTFDIPNIGIIGSVAKF